MKKSWLFLLKCFSALVCGFLWVVFLFEDASDNVGSSYKAEAVVFLSFGTILPIGFPIILIEIWDLSKRDLVLSGIALYLFSGLIAGLILGNGQGSSFFPVSADK